MNQSPKRPIFCATDFSEEAVHAGNVAAALAIRLEAPLTLIHGVDERGEIPAAFWPSIVEALSPQLSREAARLRWLGVTVDEVMAGGIPDDGVVHRAEQAGAQLIVAASSGHGALGRWMLGSVSERIAESAWVPTLVVREAARLEEWARGGKPLRVFIGAYFTAASDEAMSWAAGLQHVGPCEFTVGFVDRLAEERAEQALHAPADTPRAPEMQEMLRHDLRERASAYFPKHVLHVRVLPAAGQADRHLLELAAEAAADLIVVGTHQWRGLSRVRHPSVSRRILHAARVSVACVPARHVVTGGRPCLSRPNRVLVATDLTTHGSRAVPQAFTLPETGGAIWLLHITAPGTPAAPLLEQLRALIPSDAEALGLHVHPVVLPGRDASSAICAAAERLEADIVCLGARSGGKISADGLGSTARGVLRQCPRPVLIVPRAPR